MFPCFSVGFFSFCSVCHCSVKARPYSLPSCVPSDSSGVVQPAFSVTLVADVPMCFFCIFEKLFEVFCLIQLFHFVSMNNFATLVRNTVSFFSMHGLFASCASSFLSCLFSCFAFCSQVFFLSPRIPFHRLACDCGALSAPN